MTNRSSLKPNGKTKLQSIPMKKNADIMHSMASGKQIETLRDITATAVNTNINNQVSSSLLQANADKPRVVEINQTNYSKRMRSKYLLNYYSKVGKEKRETNRSYISEDTYSFVHGMSHEYKPQVKNNNLRESNTKQEKNISKNYRSF